MSDRSRRSGGRTPDNEAAALGHAIKVLRTEQGVDRAELAEASRLSYPYLSEIENGKKRPSSRALDAIAEALGMRPHELLASADWRMGTTERPVIASQRTQPERSWLRSDDAMMEMTSEADRRDELRAELIRLIERLPPDDVARLLELARRFTMP